MGTWIGYLGRLEEEKGTDLLLEAFLRAFHSGEAVHLVLIGAGHLEEKLRRRAGSLAGRRVHFAGEVADSASLRGRLGEAARSRARGFSVEAMAEAYAALYAQASRWAAAAGRAPRQ